MTENPSQLNSGKPLKNPEDDRLGYAHFAEMLAKSIVEMTPPEGLVIGIYGDWGMGKSTVMEFIEYYLKEKHKDKQPIIVRFNPWWFSGSENLVKHFFEQLQSILAKRGHKWIKGFVRSLDAFSNVAVEAPGAGMAKAAKSQLDEIRRKDLNQLKDDVAEILAGQDQRILVIIDDIFAS